MCGSTPGHGRCCPVSGAADEVKVGKDVPRKVGGMCRRNDDPWGFWASPPVVLKGAVLDVSGHPQSAQSD